MSGLTQVTPVADLRSHVICADVLSQLIASMPGFSAQDDGVLFSLVCSMISQWEDLSATSPYLL